MSFSLSLCFSRRHRRMRVWWNLESNFKKKWKQKKKHHITKNDIQKDDVRFKELLLDSRPTNTNNSQLSQFQAESCYMLPKGVKGTIQSTNCYSYWLLKFPTRFIGECGWYNSRSPHCWRLAYDLWKTWKKSEENNRLWRKICIFVVPKKIYNPKQSVM